MPSCTHDDIDRRASSRDVGAVLSFFLLTSAYKQKAAETPMWKFLLQSN